MNINIDGHSRNATPTEETIIHQVRTVFWNRFLSVIDEVDNNRILSDADMDLLCESIDSRKQTLFACDRYGHYMIDDQCGKPEHRYYKFCEKILG